MEYGDLDKKYQQSTFGAHFVEVGVDAVTGETRVRRMLAVCAAGRILNPKTARSQMLGGVVWGIGMALSEESVIDHTFGRIVNASLGEYHVVVNADIRDIDVIFIAIKDLSQGIIGKAVDGKMTGPLYLKGFAPE